MGMDMDVDLPLSGDWQQVEGFNANGIEAPHSGRYLMVVNSTVGMLYRVNPKTGAATAIDLGGESVTMGDGLLLAGQALYAPNVKFGTVEDPDTTPYEIVGIPLFRHR